MTKIIPYIGIIGDRNSFGLDGVEKVTGLELGKNASSLILLGGIANDPLELLEHANQLSFGALREGDVLVCFDGVHAMSMPYD